MLSVVLTAAAAARVRQALTTRYAPPRPVTRNEAARSAFPAWARSEVAAAFVRAAPACTRKDAGPAGMVTAVTLRCAGTDDTLGFVPAFTVGLALERVVVRVVAVVGTSFAVVVAVTPGRDAAWAAIAVGAVTVRTSAAASKARAGRIIMASNARRNKRATRAPRARGYSSATAPNEPLPTLP